jgi:hypothetical protein
MYKDEILEYVKRNDRVCPMPLKWKGFWEMLQDLKTEDWSQEPGVPLILGAWINEPGLAKMGRFWAQIEWGVENGALEQVEEFLLGMKESDWFHIGDSF